MKKFIILAGSIDGAICTDTSFVNRASFGLASTKVFCTLSGAIKARNKAIKNDLEEFKGIWKESKGYSYDVRMSNNPASDAYLDIYYDKKVTNETTYKIKEVECR